ncbi:hypothetical protein Tco_0622492 [Tanacetum coccineum]
MVSHIRKLLSLKESLWVKWVHAYKLRGRSFWDIPLRDGALTSLWYDRWCSSSLLANSISTRDMFRAGLNPLSKFRNIFLNNVWTWPQELIDKYLFLSSIVMPNHVDRPDLLEWRDEDGNVKSFSASMVWRLKTQDKLNSWDVSRPLITSCPLCELQPDSHEHLFFKCSFSQQVWNHIKTYAGMDSLVLVFSHILASLIPIAKRRPAKSVIAKLVVAACAYFIWQERNWRLFKKNKR